MTDIHQNKIALDKKHLNKQMPQSLQILINVYILNITCCHMPKYFQVSVENHPNKQFYCLGVQNTTDWFLHRANAANWVFRFWKNETFSIW